MGFEENLPDQCEVFHLIINAQRKQWGVGQWDRPEKISTFPCPGARGIGGEHPKAALSPFSTSLCLWGGKERWNRWICPKNHLHSPGWDDPATRNEPEKRKCFHQGPVKEDLIKFK